MFLFSAGVVIELNGNETCEWEDGGSERERSGSRSRSKSYSKSGSKSKSATVGKSGEATHTGRGRSDTRNGTPRNQTATLSSLPEHILLLLSSRSGRVEEEEELYRIRGSSVGAASRNVLRNILTFSDSCRPGFYCKKTSRTHGVCSPVNEDSLFLLKFLSLCYLYLHIPYRTLLLSISRCRKRL